MEKIIVPRGSRLSSIMIHQTDDEQEPDPLVAEWHASAALQAEFTTPESYAAYTRGCETHNVRIMGGGVAK